MIITLKSGEKMLDIVALAKGLISPEDLRTGGQMSAQAASRIITMLFADPFLQKVTTERMSRLTKDIDVIDIARRQLVRVAEGSEPADADLVGVGEEGGKLRALEVQLFAALKLSTLRDNKDNPNLIKIVEDGFNTRLTGDLVDLAFNGENDDGGGANQAEKFLRLNKGWVKIAQEAEAADGVQGVDIDPATDGWKATLSAIMNAGDERWRPMSAFLMNLADADAYAEELGAHVTGTPLTAESPLRRYQGYPIEAHPRMPRGKVLFTPLKNLVYGVSTDIRRDRAYHARKRALEYTFDMATDFEIAVKQAVAFGRPGA